MKVLVWLGKGLLLIAKAIPALLDWLTSENKGKHVAKKAGGRAVVKKVSGKLKRFGI